MVPFDNGGRLAGTGTRAGLRSRVMCRRSRALTGDKTDSAQLRDGTGGYRSAFDVMSRWALPVWAPGRDDRV